MQGGAIRTPIRFGATLKQFMDKHIPGRTQIVDETTERFILHAFRHDLEDGWYGFLMVQGARQQGRYTVELGLSRRPELPYYEATLTPFMAVDSLRQRVGFLDGGEDKWYTYLSQNELEVSLNRVLAAIRDKHEPAMREQYQGPLEDAMGQSVDAFLAWKDAEAANAEVPLGQRFPECVQERGAYDYIQTALSSNRFGRVLGPIARRYLDDPRWLSCHTYQMAQLLENVRTETINEYNGNWTGFSDDQSTWLTGRVSLVDWIEVPPRFEERTLQYCFLKSLAVCEAWLGEK